jgi:hypothetical protein
MGFKLGLYGGQLFGLFLLIYQQEIVCPEKCIQWHKNGLVCHLVGK